MTKPKTTTATTANDKKKYFDNSESFDLLKNVFNNCRKVWNDSSEHAKTAGRKDCIWKIQQPRLFVFLYTEVTTAAVVLNNLNLNNNSKGFFFNDTAPSTLVATIL